MENEDTWPGLHGPAKTASDAFYNVRDYVQETLDQAGQQIGNEMARAADNFDQVVETSVSTIQENAEKAKVWVTENTKAAGKQIIDTFQEFKEENIVGSDFTYEEMTPVGNFKAKNHFGGNIFIYEYNANGVNSSQTIQIPTGWSINNTVNIPFTNMTITGSWSGTSYDIQDLKLKYELKKYDDHEENYISEGLFYDKNGMSTFTSEGYKSGTMPVTVPSGLFETQGDFSWSLTQEFHKHDWDAVLKVAGVLAAIAIVVIVIDQRPEDDGAIDGLEGIVTAAFPNLSEKIASLWELLGGYGDRAMQYLMNAVNSSVLQNCPIE